jgi:hypothetical protein
MVGVDDGDDVGTFDGDDVGDVVGDALGQMSLLFRTYYYHVL